MVELADVFPEAAEQGDFVGVEAIVRALNAGSDDDVAVATELGSDTDENIADTDDAPRTSGVVESGGGHRAVSGNEVSRARERWRLARIGGIDSSE